MPASEFTLKYGGRWTPRPVVEISKDEESRRQERYWARHIGASPSEVMASLDREFSEKVKKPRKPK